MKIGTMITRLPRQQPWKITREGVSIDRLSHGRLIMGVRLGNLPEEYSTPGEDPQERIWAQKLDKGLWITLDSRHVAT